MSLTFTEVSFITSSTRMDNLPAPTVGEVAVAGLSNVGKSSLLNRVLGRKNMVKTSKLAGGTRMLNYFHAETKGFSLFLVDMPGYGFAHRSKSEQRHWEQLLTRYLSTRETLQSIWLLVDIRRGLTDRDAALLDLAENANKPVTLFATKADKLSKSAQKPAAVKIAKEAGQPIIITSAHTGQGVDLAHDALRNLFEPT